MSAGGLCSVNYSKMLMYAIEQKQDDVVNRIVCNSSVKVCKRHVQAAESRGLRADVVDWLRIRSVG